jgi:hypothetical protein
MPSLSSTFLLATVYCPHHGKSLTQKSQYNPPRPNTAQPAAACDQYGSCPYGSLPGGGRVNGTSIRKTLAIPKKMAAAIPRWDVGCHVRDGRNCRYTIPKEIAAFITANGYEIWDMICMNKLHAGSLKDRTYGVNYEGVGITRWENEDRDHG